MRLLFIDTETTGLPLDDKADYKETDNWPRLVQLSWVLYDDIRKIKEERDFIIKPDGYEIPVEAATIHRITNEIAIEKGHSLKDVLSLLLDDAKSKSRLVKKGNVTYVTFDSLSAIVGHNVSFDINVIRSEMYRLGLDDKCIDNRWVRVSYLDTMKLGRDYCAFVNENGIFKNPTLTELYFKIFSTTYEDVHSSLADVKATYACFWEMINRGIINKKDYECLLNDAEREQLSKEYLEEARCYNESGDKKHALEYLQKSASLGNLQATYHLAEECIKASEYIKAENLLNSLRSKQREDLLDKKGIIEYKKTLKLLLNLYEAVRKLHWKYIFGGSVELPKEMDLVQRAGIIMMLEHFDIIKHLDKVKEIEKTLKELNKSHRNE